MAWHAVQFALKRVFPSSALWAFVEKPKEIKIDKKKRLLVNDLKIFILLTFCEVPVWFILRRNIRK
jgi:hypothetical protein